MQMEQVDPRADAYLVEAVEAVRAMLATRHEGRYAAGLGPDYRPERDARDAVRRASRWDWTPAQIAHLAGVRQLLVVRLVDDPDQRAEALVAARHDAERYMAEVMSAVRAEAVRRWRAGGGRRGVKAEISGALGVSRPTLDEWFTAADAADL